MLGRTSNRVLIAGIGVSVLLHVSGAWVWYALGQEGAGSAFERPELNEPPPDPTSRIELGDPESRAVSMSWIGFDEYKKHVAMEAEVDQPALTMDPASAASGAAGSISAARTAMEQATSAARAEAQKALEEMAAGLKALGSWANVLPDGREDVKDLVAAGTSDSPTKEMRQEQAKPAEQEAKQQEKIAKEQKAGEEAAAQGETGSGTVVGTVAQRAVEGESGQKDDRESDPTSVNRNQLGDPGHPLAARGLRIRTVRPVFSHYTSIMTNPRHPVVRIYFDSRGRAKRVELLEASGNPDIDRPVLDAVYRWTATGESLKELGGSETVTVDVRILL